MYWAFLVFSSVTLAQKNSYRQRAAFWLGKSQGRITLSPNPLRTLRTLSSNVDPYQNN